MSFQWIKLADMATGKKKKNHKGFFGHFPSSSTLSQRLFCYPHMEKASSTPAQIFTAVSSLNNQKQFAFDELDILHILYTSPSHQAGILCFFCLHTDSDLFPPGLEKDTETCSIVFA